MAFFDCFSTAIGYSATTVYWSGISTPSAEAAKLSDLLAGPEVTLRPDAGALEVSGLTPEQIGDAAFAHGIVLHELTPMQASLEEAFMELTREDVEFHSPESREPAEAAA